MKFYRVILGKHEIVVDEDDYSKIENGIKTGSLIKTKTALINPSFLVAIIPEEVKPKVEQQGEFITDEHGHRVFKVTGEKKIYPVIPDSFSKQNRINAPRP
jgi:hypothetical protein